MCLCVLMIGSVSFGSESFFFFFFFFFWESWVGERMLGRDGVEIKRKIGLSLLIFSFSTTL